ncbi:TF29 protein, partial [Ibidorhyncha struthersii]|nr:TF29 protein [Ibidorhyncha struthersii]
ILEEIIFPPGIKLLQYVDDLLISGEKEEEVWSATIKLLIFLGEKGLRVSKTKLQFVEKEVKYLGHLISEGKRRISQKQISSTVAVTLPKSKKEIRKFL